MIRTSLMAVAGGEAAGNVGGGDGCNIEATAVPEELFRKYTETDSRPPTPAPTLASGPVLTNRAATQEDLPATCNPRERTTLVLDLRAANSQHHQVVGSRASVQLPRGLRMNLRHPAVIAGIALPLPAASSHSIQNSPARLSGERDVQLARTHARAAADAPEERDIHLQADPALATFVVGGTGAATPVASFAHR